MPKEQQTLLFAAPHSGSGKTTVVLGILAALRARKISIRPYKVGPDYIDTSYHQAICQKEAINLDGYLLSEQQLKAIFQEYNDSQMAIIEGVMGLYDGIGTTTKASTASVAKAIHAPVVLVIDARGMAASVAAMIQGFCGYEKMDIRGVIFNQIRSDSHFQLLKTVVERDTNILCLGYLKYDEAIRIPSRHLGILPYQEQANAMQIIEKIRENVEQHIDIEKLIRIASAYENEQPVISTTPDFLIPCDIAVGFDASMSFYYHDNLQLLQQAGANLHFFKPIKDQQLPHCDGIYLGGGFPEIFAEQLELNDKLRKQIKQAADRGVPIYAECGGYMYLMDSITTQEHTTHQMCGVFAKTHATMQKKLNMQFGYVETKLLEDLPIGKKGFVYRNHEFHHSIAKEASPAYQSRKISNDRIWYGGSTYKNCFGTYAHMMFRSDLNMLKSFLSCCHEHKNHVR